jgi:heterodisulfide reductase subunit A
MKTKIGVYICHCGGNISDYVDVQKVREAVEKEGGVFLAKTTLFACSDAGQKEMVEDIKAQGLDGLVVASCSPKLHQITFQNVAERAGLNKYNYVHANIREQISWPHSDDKEGATEKAIAIVKAAIAKVRLAQSLQGEKIKTEQSIAIIGAGVAGLKAAITLAKSGIQVYLIEREHFIGGRVAQWGTLFPTNESGNDIISKLQKEIVKNEKITLFTGAELDSYSGSVGNFTVNIKIKPRYVKDNYDTQPLQKAIEVCPVTVPDPFTFGLTSRKAIYVPSQYPNRPVIDMNACTRCGACEKVCNAIDFSQQETSIELKVGSMLIATGFDPYQPQEGEFGYHQFPNVITLPQFKQLVDSSEGGKLIYQNKVIQNIAYIYCVGSRQVDGPNKYCSRYCCTSTIHTALEAKKKFPDIYNFHLHRGIRTYGKQEVFYTDSLLKGDIYFQFDDYNPPTLEEHKGKTLIKVNDILTKQENIEIEADLVVLVTGMVPRENTSLENTLKLPKGRDNFFNEIHMKLRPVETAIDGITIAGASQGPKNITESVNSALSAAIKSYSYISRGELELQPTVAVVNKDACTWCGLCQEACPFDAIRKEEDGEKAYAVILNSVCKGCGMCTPVCPTDAIDLITYSNQEIESMIDAIATNF